MAEDFLVSSAWRAFEQHDYVLALKLFREAERKYGNLFSVNISVCLAELSANSAMLLPVVDVLQTKMPGLTELRLDQRKRVAGLASMPSRVDTLEKVLSSVIPQVDEVHLYLNNFEQIPAFVAHEKVTLYRSQQYGDLRDNGKFFGLQYCDDDSYYFTLDDDLDYPAGYFAALIHKINAYQDQVAVGVHGVIYARSPRTFFDRLAFNFERELRTDLPVSVLGTGTVGFYTGTVKPLMNTFTDTGMADLMFAAYLKQHNVPAICIARPTQWLKEYQRDDRTDAIYQQTRLNTKRYDAFLAAQAPWGAGVIQETVAVLKPQLCQFAYRFIEWLQGVEQQRCIMAVASQPAAEFRGLFETCGYTALADNYYHAVADALLGHLLEQNSQISPDNKALCQDIVQHYSAQQDCSSWHLSEVLLVEELARYQAGANSPELALKLALLSLLQQPQQTAEPLNGLINALLALGDSGLILKHFSTLQSALTPQQQLTLVTMLVNDNVTVPVELLNKLHAMAQDSAAVMFVNCLLLLAKRSSTADAAIAAFVSATLNADTKLGYLKQLLAFYAETALQPDTATFAQVLQHPAVTADIKRLIAQLLLSKESATDISLHDVIVRLVAVEGFAFETALWQAELHYQSGNDIGVVLGALNDMFVSSGLLPVRYDSTIDTSFLAALQPEVTHNAQSYGCCSVVIAAYNAESTLQYAYDSVCRQSYADIDIIIIDDCSDIAVSDYLQLDNTRNTRIIRNTQNLGPYGCRNVALSMAKGSYFLVHDADDWAHPQKIEQQILTLQDEALVCSYSRHIRVSSSGHLKLENHGHFIGHGPMTSMFKMRVFAELGQFDEVPTRGDMEFKARIQRYFGHHAIYEDQRLMLLALDWQSNSKQKTATTAKKVKLARYKNHYSAWHRLVPFWRQHDVLANPLESMPVGSDT